jgi:hypothetical protein
LLLCVDRGKAFLLALLDFSAAFDTIDHVILFDRIFLRFGISGSVLQWFRSYLTIRNQSVGVNGSFSSPVTLTFGVPQGSVCGPIQFIIYNSPLHDIASTLGISDHGYADDEQLYISFRSSTDGVP